MSKGAQPSADGLSQQAAEPVVSALTGFDPSRMIVLCDDVQSRLDGAKSFYTCEDAETLETYHDSLVDAVRLLVGGLHAIATEARRAATGNTDAVADEGAGPKDIAQTPGQSGGRG